MIVITAKEYLQQIEKLNILIEIKWKEIQRTREMLTNITVSSDSDPVKHSSSGDKFGTIIAKIVDMENELNFDIDIYVDEKNRALEHLKRLEPNHLQLLYKRYFEFKKWETIADEMCYDIRSTYRLHGAALEELERILKSCQ